MATQPTTNPSKLFKGFIRLYIGPMFSGKTQTLLESYTRHSIGNRRCLLIKHKSDSRYDPVCVVTHSGQKAISSFVCSCLYEVDNIVNNYDVICVDEIQFFADAAIFCDKWANQGLIIEAVGLSGTYARCEFPVISQLIPLAEEVHKKSAICRETGNDAHFTCRTSGDTETIVIGGIDKYKPVDRITFFGDITSDAFKKYNLDAFLEFVIIYVQKNKITLPQDIQENLIQYFNNNISSHNSYVSLFESFLSNKNEK